MNLDTFDLIERAFEAGGTDAAFELLIRRLLEAKQYGHYSPRTEHTSVAWIRRVIVFHSKGYRQACLKEGHCTEAASPESRDP